MNTYEIELAEAQLTGYQHARSGLSLASLADEMGLTPSELAQIMVRGHVRLSDDDLAELSNAVTANVQHKARR